jgi:SAM-dependent methyltransferase
MANGRSLAGADDVSSVRAEYESSLSRRVTRPLRALRRRPGAQREPAAAPAAVTYDSWLEHFHGERLRAIDAACAGGGPECFALFRDLDADLWALLLTQEYTSYPNIRALLPDVPEPVLQEMWVGASGVRLAAQSKDFYVKLRDRYAAHSGRGLSDSRVLDFGCGWGRLTRLLARDVEPGKLHGCDPVEGILDACRACRVPAELARSEFLPDRVPFDGQFDLAFSFSVFTHLSEAAHEHSLRALHAALRPGAILVVTVRPPDFLSLCEALHPALASLGPDPQARLREPHYLFAPHPAGPSNLVHDGGELTYGETVITLPYVEQRWAPQFELLAADVLLGDLYQVMLTLRRA